MNVERELTAFERVREGETRFVPSWMMATLGLLVVVSLALQHGFRLGESFDWWFNHADVLLAVSFAVALVLGIATARHWRDALGRRRFEAGMLGVLCIALLLAAILPAPTLKALFAVPHGDPRQDVVFGCIKIFLLLNVCIQALRTLRRVFVAGLRLELVLAGSFIALIIIGMLLLLLPRASAQPEAPITLVDALFTATSAVCVTGLVVLDTGTDFSTLGQLSILALFQVGGLGIITFVAFVSAFSAKTLPVPQMVAFRQMINAPEVSDLKRRLAGIVLLTAVIELAGVIALYLAYSGGDALTRLKWSVFHGVSAFCNAGFSLQSNSLEFARANPAVNWTVMTLIVLGGLGFLVLPELIMQAAARTRRAASLLHPGSRPIWRKPAPRMTVQTRISIYVTLWLIFVGCAGFWLLEHRHILSGSGAGEAFLASLFQSITTRTAGFNTVPTGDLTQATLLLFIVLMVIGGCPVSTSGGIKTVTFGVLFLAMRSMIFRQEKVEAFGRTLAARAFFTALTVLVLYIGTGVAGVFLLSIFDPHLALRDTSFETISALSTVGLSTGITAKLSDPSKLVLCAAMFIGRVGPISIVFSVFQRRGRVEYEFPAEDVVVG